MLGALVGDWCGSSLEWRPPWRQSCPPWHDAAVRSSSRFTDDSVLTVATADALLRSSPQEVTAQDFAQSYKLWGRRYPDAGYGSGFQAWLLEEKITRRSSWANGAAMRVSPVAWAASSLDEALELARRSAQITHHHPEAFRGASSLAGAIYLTRTGASRETLKGWIENTWGYDLSPSVEELWCQTSHDCSCRTTVPQAMIAFLSASSFEEALQKALSLGGDSDTLGAMTGALAEARWGVSQELKNMVTPLIPLSMTHILHSFDASFGVISALLCQEDYR